MAACWDMRAVAGGGGGRCVCMIGLHYSRSLNMESWLFKLDIKLDIKLVALIIHNSLRMTTSGWTAIHFIGAKFEIAQYMYYVSL